MRKWLIALCGIAVIAACNTDDEYDPTGATNMARVSGSGQTGEVGTTLPDSLTVVVTNLQGDPVEDVEVEWFAVNGGGNVSSGVTRTSATGVAQVAYVVGPVVGTQEVQARAGSLSGSPVSFSVNARASSGGGGPPPENP